MKALVIGASGLVGKALHAALERSGVEVRGTFCGHPAECLTKLDVTDAAAVQKYVREFHPDVIFLAVNVAGGTDYCEDHPEQAQAIHVEGTRNVARAAADAKAVLVYFSTDYIFDGKQGPYAEDDTPSPISVYGEAKLQAEKLIQQVIPGHLILRTTAVFGWDRTSPNFAMRIGQKLQLGESVDVPSDQWCNPTLADYLAEISLRLVQQGTRGIVNVVGADRITRSDFALALARALALDAKRICPLTTAQLQQRAPRPLNAGLRTRRLAELLGTGPMILEEALKRFRRQWRMDTHTVVSKSSQADDGLKRRILDGVREYYRTVHEPKRFVPYKTRVQYSGRVFGSEEMVNLVDSSLEFLLTMGPYGELFEQKMKKYFGAKDFVLVNSGSTANLTAVMSLMSEQLDRPLKPGDEVITPATTFPTTAAPIVHSGLIPVFVDVELDTYNVDPALVAAAVSEKTRALFIPHTLGNPCDMDAISQIAQRHHLYLIEDSCDALGATFRDRLVGTFGDVATLSFFPAHQITMGEGGGVIVNNPRLSRIARSVRDWGRDCWCAPGESNTCGKRFGWQLGDLPQGYDHKYIYSNLGYNFKPTDMQAAIGVAQAERIPDFVAKRRHNFQRLYQGLQGYRDHLILPRLDTRSNPSWFGFPITVQNGLRREEIVQFLERANIETRGVFAGNILKQPAYRNIRRRVCGQLTQTDRIMRDTFFIGVYPGLTDEMIDFVLGVFEKFFAERPADSDSTNGIISSCR